MSGRELLDYYADAMVKLCNDHAAEKRRIAARIREIATDARDWAALVVALGVLADELEGK